MHELVIVLTDLYLSGEAPSMSLGTALPGIEHAGRFGERVALAHGWRAWLAGLLGRADLAAVAPATIAAGVLGASPAPQWLATPLHLSAGLSRVHLEHRGLLRLGAPEQASLIHGFARAFAGSGLELRALPCGEFLLEAPGIPAVPATEPARCAGGEIAAALPQGPQSAALRRVAAEIEMWLHGELLNTQRVRQGDLAVNALWLWGATGAALPQLSEACAGATAPLAFGSDAYLDGLSALLGAGTRALPEDLEAVLAGESTGRTVVALSVAAELQRSPQAGFAQALAALDARFIAPALAALALGRLERVSLAGNDTALTLGRRSGLRLWRRARPGLASLAWG